jgi:hypothetical protein
MGINTPNEKRVHYETNNRKQRSHLQPKSAFLTAQVEIFREELAK